MVRRFKLNNGQARVAAHVASWLPKLAPRSAQAKAKRSVSLSRLPDAAAAAGAAGAAVPQPPVCLVHGPFGTGKSTLLVALLQLMACARSAHSAGVPVGAVQPVAGEGGGGACAAMPAASAGAAPPGPRILVAAHTNVAVDRVLLGLLEAGFTDVLRVGSLARIAKPLLRYSLHCADDSRDAVSQLTSMLNEAAGAEADMIRWAHEGPELGMCVGKRVCVCERKGGWGAVHGGTGWGSGH